MGQDAEAFWRETPYETSCRYIGWCRANGAGRYRVDPETGMSEADVEQFVAQHTAEVEEMKRRFPDVPRERRRVKAHA